jgi:hypothetical protein
MTFFIKHGRFGVSLVCDGDNVPSMAQAKRLPDGIRRKQEYARSKIDGVWFVRGQRTANRQTLAALSSWRERRRSLGGFISSILCRDMTGREFSPGN